MQSIPFSEYLNNKQAFLSNPTTMSTYKLVVKLKNVNVLTNGVSVVYKKKRRQHLKESCVDYEQAVPEVNIRGRHRPA